MNKYKCKHECVQSPENIRQNKCSWCGGEIVPEYGWIELLLEIIWSILRDIFICSLTLGIIAGAMFVLWGGETSAMSLKTTLTGRPDIAEMLQKRNEIDPMDKLAKAVAMHETHDCKDDTNFTRVNNCFGVRKWNGEKLVPAKYATKEDAYEDFKEIWGRMYGTEIPTMQNAIRWSGNDNATAWFENVNYFIKTM